MKWLLLILVFDVSKSGMEPVMRAAKACNSEAGCEAEGERLQRDIQYPGENIRRVSICVPESAFTE